MSVLQTRGGVPHLIKATVDTTGRYYRFPFVTSGILVRVTTDALRIFFSQEDFDGGVNFFQVDPVSAAYPYGQFEAPIEAKGLWLKAATTTAVIDLLAFQRRG